MKKFLVIAAFMGFLSVSAANAQTSAPVASDKMAPAQETKKAEAAPAKSCCSHGGAKSSGGCSEDKKSSSTSGKSCCSPKASTEAKPATAPATTGKKSN